MTKTIASILFATLTVMLLLVRVVPAPAASVTKLTFRAYSSSTPVSCGVFGMGPKLRKDPSTVIQGFSPDPAYSRTYSLGTKGYGNYSTVYPSGTLTAVKFTCRNTGTNTSTKIKLNLNALETHFLTTDSEVIVIGYPQ